MANQELIDNYVTELNDSFDKITTEIAALKDQVANGETLDFTGLDAAVARGQGLEPPVVETPAEPPVETPPADETPVV